MLHFLGNDLLLKGLNVGRDGFFETFYSLSLKRPKSDYEQFKKVGLLPQTVV